MKNIGASRGITHIEDLHVSEFIDVVKNIHRFKITEKVDGAQILFGIDENGFYTSRESKGGVRIYDERNYSLSFSSTYMRSAHKLLEKMLPLLKEAGLSQGDQVEAEVLYGELPNVVPYSADRNYLIFLRTIQGGVNIDYLQEKLCNESTSITLESPYTPNGKDIFLREETNVWKFDKIPEISVVFQSIDKKVFPIISELNKFLDKKSGILDTTNRIIESTALNGIPVWCNSSDWKTLKEEVKEKRDRIKEQIKNRFILKIKEILLDSIVRNSSSKFGPSLDSGGWIEGVVLTDTSGMTVKLVDKNVFGTIREDAWRDRNRLSEHARGIDSPGGFLGSLYLDLAISLGHPELGTIQASRYIRKLGESREEQLVRISSSCNFHQVKEYWHTLLDIKENILDEDLDKYNNAFLPIDKLQNAVRVRTLQTFAFLFEKIKEDL